MITEFVIRSSGPGLYEFTPGVADWLAGQSDHLRNWVAANGFKGALGQVLTVPSTEGGAGFALAGYGTEGKRARKRRPRAGTQ